MNRLLKTAMLIVALTMAAAHAPIGHAQDDAGEGHASAADLARAERIEQQFQDMNTGERIWYRVQLSVVGMVIVMCVLALIAAGTALISRLDAPAEAPAPAGAAPAVRAGPDDRTVALITAAVAAAMAGRRFQIRSIQLRRGPTTWGVSGREGIHSSHALERKSR